MSTFRGREAELLGLSSWAVCELGVELGACALLSFSLFCFLFSFCISRDFGVGGKRKEKRRWPGDWMDGWMDGRMKEKWRIRPAEDSASSSYWSARLAFFFFFFPFTLSLLLSVVSSFVYTHTHTHSNIIQLPVRSNNTRLLHGQRERQPSLNCRNSTTRNATSNSLGWQKKEKPATSHSGRAAYSPLPTSDWVVYIHLSFSISHSSLWFYPWHHIVAHTHIGLLQYSSCVEYLEPMDFPLFSSSL